MLESLSMVSANFGNELAYRVVLADWFHFLGGKPGEVVVVDGGSDRDTQEVYWQLLHDGKIDKLQVIRPDHPQNHKDLCFIQEYYAGLLASKPYVLFFKIDTLPFREGHDGWLDEALACLDQEGVFAVGGSFNIAPPRYPARVGWYACEYCSENFAIMKRDTFVSAMQEFAGDYIASGFRSTNPASVTGQSRYLVEVAFERYMRRHGLKTWVKQEDLTWTIAHTNLADEALHEARQRYLAREGICSYITKQQACSTAPGVYYGQRPVPWSQRLRVAFGASKLGPSWRHLKAILGYCSTVLAFLTLGSLLSCWSGGFK